MVKTIWEKIKTILKKITVFQSKALLFLIYFIFITPVAILFKILSDPLNLKGRPYWFLKVENEKEINQLKNQ